MLWSSVNVSMGLENLDLTLGHVKGRLTVVDGVVGGVVVVAFVEVGVVLHGFWILAKLLDD